MFHSIEKLCPMITLIIWKLHKSSCSFQVELSIICIQFYGIWVFLQNKIKIRQLLAMSHSLSKNICIYFKGAFHWPYFRIRIDWNNLNVRSIQSLFSGILILLTYTQNGYSGIIRNLFLFPNRVNRTHPKFERDILSCN